MLTMPYQHAGGCDGLQNVLFCSVSLIVSIGKEFKLNVITQPQICLYDIITGICFHHLQGDILARKILILIYKALDGKIS